MVDVLIIVGVPLIILMAAGLPCYFIELESTRKRPRTLKRRIKAKIKELERGLQGSEKQLLNLRLKKLEASKQEASLFDKDIELNEYSIKYYKSGIRLLKDLL